MKYVRVFAQLMIAMTLGLVVPARGASSQPATKLTVAGMHGFYAMSPASDRKMDDEKLSRQLANPYINGIFLSVVWKDLEPQAGHYDFATLDHAVAMIRAAHKQYKLNVTPGIDCPAYIYAEGAQPFDTQNSNPNLPTIGQQVRMPVPWDPVYQKHFSLLIQVLGARYGADPHCVAVVLSCANFGGNEMHLPRGPEDMKKWDALGLSEPKLLAVYTKYTDEWARAFPHSLVSLLAVGTPLPLKGTAPWQLADQIIDYGLQHYPQQINVQTCILMGRREMPLMPGDALATYKNKMSHGYQSLASFNTQADRQGSIEMSVLNYIAVDAQYWEFWQGDGVDSALCGKVQDELKKAQAMGYDAYKKQLIATGKYRTAESDTWHPRFANRK